MSDGLPLSDRSVTQPIDRISFTVNPVDPGTDPRGFVSVAPGTTIIAPFDMVLESFSSYHTVAAGAPHRLGVAKRDAQTAAIGNAQSLETGELLVAGGTDSTIDLAATANVVRTVSNPLAANGTPGNPATYNPRLIRRGERVYLVAVDNATGLVPTNPAAGLGVVHATLNFVRNRA